MSDKLHIDTMFAFIAEGQEGEGVCGFKTGNGWLPMVGADMERIESLRPMAQAIAEVTGQTIRLVKFTERHEMEIIQRRIP